MLKSRTFSILRNIGRTKAFTRVVCHQSYQRNNNNHHGREDQQSKTRPLFLLASVSLWDFIKGKDPEKELTPEDKLITNIKRGILSIQKGDYKTAEKLLHVALKMAQDLQHSQGITYIYDILANLAMEAGDFEKAEKIFVNVMQRLFADGHKEDSIKMLHISAKMAHMCHFREQYEKAMQGFEWTLEKLKEKLQKITDDEELNELYGLTKNWYAQLLMDKKLYKMAREHFEEAYAIYTKVHGELTMEGIMILNNLSVACSEMDDIAGAIENLKKVVELAKEIPKMEEIGVFHANLGLLYLKQSLINEATEACQLGYRLGMKLKSKDAVDQATYCLNRIKEFNK